jgi:hypothetical protein
LDDAARSHLPELPDALDRALARADLGATRTPWWWSLGRAAQWLFAVAALGGLGWLAAAALAPAFGAHHLRDPKVGPLPLAALVAAGALLAGLLLRLLLVPLAAAAARGLHERALRRLRGSVYEVARQQVVEPVRELLGRYARASAALASAGSLDADDGDDRSRPAGTGSPHAGAGAGRS